MELYKCSVCGLVREPEDGNCSKCGAPPDMFRKLSDEEAEKIYASDRTNDILMQVVDCARKIIKLSEEGIEINLDPGCLSDFKKAKDAAWAIKQRAKAEIAIHLGKGKW